MTVTKKEILKYIETIQKSTGNVDSIIKHYRNGYCYFLALILKDTFSVGELMWAAPYSHIVFYYQGTAYDIEGEYVSDATLIPISYLGHHIQGFKHNPNYSSSITKEEIYNIISNYKTKKH